METMTIIVFLILFAIFAVVSVLVRERGFQLSQFWLKKEEKDDDKEIEDKPKKALSKGKNLLSQLLDLIVIIVILLILGTLCLVTIVTVGEIFSPARNSEVQEKVEIPWEYSQKKDSENTFKDSSPIGGSFSVKNFKHIPGEELYFEVCWRITCGDFTSDIGTDETGVYRNFSNKKNPEEGIFTVKWDGEKFTGRMTCKKNCRANKGYLFTLEKR